MGLKIPRCNRRAGSSPATGTIAVSEGRRFFIAKFWIGMKTALQKVHPIHMQFVPVVESTRQHVGIIEDMYFRRIIEA